MPVLLPNKLSESGKESKFLNWCNRLRAFAQSCRLLESPDFVIEYTDLGQRVRLKEKSGGGKEASPDWADPIVYDKTKTYKKGEIVVVRPTDSIVTTGALDFDTSTVKKSIAGTWKALKDVTLSGDESLFGYHIPKWPMTVADNPDSESNYWWPLSFYPQIVTDCDGTNSLDVWTNAQKK